MAQTAANFVHEGRTIDYTPSTDVTAGDVIRIGAITAIALRDIDANTLGALAVEGVFDVPKIADQPISAGHRVYWDPAATSEDGNTGAARDDDGGDDNIMGWAVAAAAASDETVRVKLAYGDLFGGQSSS